MIIRRVAGLCVLFVIVATLVAAGAARAHDDDTIILRTIVTTAWHADGTTATRVEPAYPPGSRARAVVPTDLRNFSSAIPTRSAQWRTNTKSLPYDFTPDAIQYAAKIKKVMSKYLNKRAGNGNVPKFSTTNKQIPVKSLASFGNDLFAYKTQFDNDDHNLIVMTQDDQFFKNSNGQLENPDVVAWSRLTITAHITMQGDRWIGTYFMEDADVWLRLDFFTLTTLEQQMLLAGTLRACLGYQKTVCIYDINADMRVMSSAMFKSKTSPIWTLAKEMDNLFYSDSFTDNAPAGYLATPRVLPLDDAVLDLNDYLLPDTNAANPSPLVNVPALFVTNLKAYEGNKSFSATFDALPAAGAPAGAGAKITILKISGNAYDYPKSITINGAPTPWYPTIHLNYILLGQQDGLSKLQAAIDQYGTPLTVAGAGYDKALKCAVTLSGYLDESGSQKKVVRTVYLTY